MAATALQTLALSAQLLGIDPRATLPPAPAKPAAPARVVVARAALPEVVRRQRGGWISRLVGEGTLELAAGFDGKGELWIKLRQGGKSLAFAESVLEKGIEQDLPAGRVRLAVTKGVLSVTPVSPAGSSVSVDSSVLVRALWDAALHEKFGPVVYALASEDGSGVPASISLIRSDAEGNFFVNYHTVPELAQISWFVGINGTLYGVRLEGAELVFYSEPVPPARARPAAAR